jgi:hypothetical protein
MRFDLGQIILFNEIFRDNPDLLRLVDNELI